jgi:hypothetical protein
MAFGGRKRIGTSYRQRLQNIVHDYMKEHHVESVDLEVVAEWAITAGRYRKQPISLAKQCKRELARACREEYYTDPQGRDVRRMHPARFPFTGGQMVLWADITKARPNHMYVSLQQRRNGILFDCRQHKTDADSYNENNRFNAALPLFDYNFATDLEELTLPTEYPNEKPE